MSVPARPNDSHESASMAQLPSTAEVDGWEVESSSAIQPSNADLAERLATEPVSTPEPEETPDPVDEDHDDATRESFSGKTEDARAPKRKRLTAAERKDVLQAEFNALTRQREEAKRQFEAEESERARVRASREASPATPKTPEAAAAAEPVEGDPDWDKYEEEGKTFAQYQKDHSAWLRKVVTAEADERASKAADARISAERSRADAVAHVARQEVRIEAAKAKYPDFEEKIEANLADVSQTPFMAAVVRNHAAGFDLLYHLADHPAEAQILSTLQMTRPMMDVVKESPDPTAILSFWANNPNEHARIAALDPVSALLALGRLSAELSSPGANTGSPARTRPMTSAKPPIRPVGATRSASASRDDDDLEFGPEYVRREIERQRASAR